MTRKDYILIAAALRRTRPTIADFTKVSPDGANTFVNGIAHEVAILVWTRTVESICDTLTIDNPRFDRGRFYAACEA